MLYNILFYGYILCLFELNAISLPSHSIYGPLKPVSLGYLHLHAQYNAIIMHSIEHMKGSMLHALHINAVPMLDLSAE